MRESVRALRRTPGRSILTIAGLGLATALVVLLLALSAGIETSAGSLAVASGVDLLATSANTSLTSGTFPPVTGAHAIPTAFRSADPNVATASPWLVSELVFANASLYAASNASANGSGVPADWSPTGSGVVGWIPGENGGLETPPVLAGPGFPSPGDPHFANGTYSGPFTRAVVLDSGLASVLHVVPGDLVWVEPTGPTGPSALPAWFGNASAFRVVGISGPFWLIPSALLGFFYLSELQSLVGGANASTDYASVILVHLSDPSNPAHDQTLLSRAFPELTVFTLGNVLGAIQQVVDLYRTFGTLIGAIGIAVATLFTSTVLLMSVDDRSREIAVTRAMGYARASIGGRVVEEALLFGAFGLLVGFPLGLGGAYGIDLFLRRILPGLPGSFSFVSLDASVLVGGAATVLLLSLAAAIAPAIRAMRMPIAEELRAP